jgi:hypothetical protein
METTTMKRLLTVETIESQAALALPSRDMLALITIVITNLLNNLDVEVDVRNNNVAVQVCAVVQALNANVGTNLTCDIRQ